MNKCPCENCVHYEFMKKHPNPNCISIHYCNKKNREIYIHQGNWAHQQGQWIIPCNGYSFKKKV